MGPWQESEWAKTPKWAVPKEAAAEASTEAAAEKEAEAQATA